MIINSGKASDILICLQDVQLAKSRLRPAIKELRDGMEECSAKAKGIEDEFDELLATANELNRAMGHQMGKCIHHEGIALSNMFYSRHCG